jgi:biopolymer transport protein ExbB
MGYLQAMAMAADSPLATPGSLAASATADDQITRRLRTALLDAKTDLETGLTALATIGNTAPFVGLFGTVWSIFNALVGIEGEGPVMINQVAGPVGEALIMTAAGLFVAIPAVIAYNALVRSNRVILAELDGFAHDLQSMRG